MGMDCGPVCWVCPALFHALGLAQVLAWERESMTYARKLRCKQLPCPVELCEFTATVFCADKALATDRAALELRQHLLWHAKADRGAVLNVARVEHQRLV